MRKNVFLISLAIIIAWLAFMLFGANISNGEYYKIFGYQIGTEIPTIAFSTLVEVTLIASIVDYLNRKQEQKNWNGWRINFCKELINKHENLIQFLACSELLDDSNIDSELKWQYYKDNLSLVPKFKNSLELRFGDIEATLLSAPIVAPSEAVPDISAYQSNIRKFKLMILERINCYVELEVLMNGTENNSNSLALHNKFEVDELNTVFTESTSGLKKIVENMILEDISILSVDLIKLSNSENYDDCSSKLNDFSDKLIKRQEAISK